jgi:hypothetical protein
MATTKNDRCTLNGNVVVATVVFLPATEQLGADGKPRKADR